MTLAPIRLLRATEIQNMLAGREDEIIEAVRRAYEVHAGGQSSLPHSVFLRFPDDPRSRIISLPAFLGGDAPIAGVKWIASFPSNHDLGIRRASAVMILNSVRTGLPEVIMEGSLISAARTAASAALAARYLHADRPAETIGLIGCGIINFEIARFLLAVFPQISTVILFDIQAEQAARFAARCRRLREDLRVVSVDSPAEVFRQAPLVALATTAVEPTIDDLSMCATGSTILHISLRDLTPQVILGCDNIVDDVDHVCRAQTSVHLAEQQVRNRDFIRCTLADITRGSAPARTDRESIAVFSPFGLGVLDLAVSQLVLEQAQRQGIGLQIDDFLPSDEAL
ncbi:MAG TPA: 2,3-diaminopropionate biosynthesis protein SbnB [Herpetosiphonaceae bacterium]